MIEIIHHVLGICGDSHTHFDFIELLSFTTAESPLTLRIKFYSKLIFLRIKLFF